jgi:hypothetical protein
MNPNGQQQNLDPKLKEAYDRVMGSQINPSQPSSPTPAPIQPQAPKVEQHQTPTSSGPQPIININSNQSPTKIPSASKGKGVSSVLFIVLGLLFFAGYTVIWLKVFKIL